MKSGQCNLSEIMVCFCAGHATDDATVHTAATILQCNSMTLYDLIALPSCAGLVRCRRQSRQAAATYGTCSGKSTAPHDIGWAWSLIKPLHMQTVVTQREGQPPMVCIEFGKPDSTPILCRVGTKADRCDLCKANVDGEPLLYRSRKQGDTFYKYIEFAVCELCAKAAVKVLRATRRHVDRRPPKLTCDQTFIGATF